VARAPHRGWWRSPSTPSLFVAWVCRTGALGDLVLGQLYHVHADRGRGGLNCQWYEE
jgi:hypothetical protein